MTMTTASMWIGGLGCPDSERGLKLTISRIIITKILLERQKRVTNTPSQCHMIMINKINKSMLQGHMATMLNH